MERRDGPQSGARGYVVNARTYEICRQAGLDMERIRAAAKDPLDAGHVNFVTRLAGDLIGRLPFERQGDECLEYTPTPLRNLSSTASSRSWSTSCGRRRASSSSTATVGTAPRRSTMRSCRRWRTCARVGRPGSAVAT
ncbi:MAG: hypothetical protein R2716_04895 [Microthrixaceae bacterium]